MYRSRLQLHSDGPRDTFCSFVKDLARHPAQLSVDGVAMAHMNHACLQKNRLEPRLGQPQSKVASASGETSPLERHRLVRFGKHRRLRSIVAPGTRHHSHDDKPSFVSNDLP